MAMARILIVEDEPLIRLFVVDSLEEFGFEVVEAENAAEAVTRLADEAGAVGAAIIDVGLPDRPGDALAEELRTKWPDLPIVIASGRDTNEFAMRFNQDSRISVLGKPYTTDMLLGALSKIGVKPDGAG
jgi:DNA-binding response OmpR family regulator